MLVPAALERQITELNAGKLKCRILAEAANGPTTPDADEILNQSDIFLIPDVRAARTGGVTVSYFEWVQDMQQFFWDEAQVNEKLEELMLKAFRQVRTLAKERKLPMRMAALSLGVQKVAAGLAWVVSVRHGVSQSNLASGSACAWRPWALAK